MYGLVNRSIEELIVARYGDAAWARVRLGAGVDEEVFLSNESYPDAVTYNLVAAASREFGVSVAEILEAFGEHWVLKTAQEHYGLLLDSCGNDLPDLLANLNNLHSRAVLQFPNLQPPKFSVSSVTATSVVLHHETHREGLSPFVFGLIRGLGKRFNLAVKVTQVGFRSPGHAHDSFHIEWPDRAGTRRSV
jgi:hypothetical protein